MVKYLILGLLGLVLFACGRDSAVERRDQIVIKAYSAAEAARIALAHCGGAGRDTRVLQPDMWKYRFDCGRRELVKFGDRLESLPVLQEIMARDAEFPSEATVARKEPAAEPPPDSRAPMTETSMPAAKSAETPKTAVPLAEPRQAGPAMVATGEAKPLPATRKPAPQPKKTVAPKASAVSGTPRARNGSVWIQVASVKRRQDASAFGRQVIARNADLLEDKSFSVQEAALPRAGTVYRSRVGPFTQYARAIDVCRALKARRQDCIVVRR